MEEVDSIMMEIDIVKASITDIADLQKIGTQTFCETFSSSNSEQDMDKYLEESFSQKKLIEEVSNSDSEFYFALINDKIVGYLKINSGEAQSDIKDPKALEIERIYVLKDFYGKSVGQVLYEKAIQIAGQIGVDYIWLGVWEKNPRAINFYQKNGFVEFDKHVFMLGDDKQTDILMKLELKRSLLPK